MSLMPESYGLHLYHCHMGTAERHILEFSFRYPGEFMFHPHQDAIAQKGCMGAFKVVSNT
jgi:FtsP/CotA-like multicopper oxidase with cupredoxin domain